MKETLFYKFMDHEANFLKLVKESKNRIQEISVEEMLKIQDDYILIDVRELEEWTLGHLPSAIHLARGILERDISKRIKNQNQMIILYCGGGFRSVLSADNLQKMGYTQVYSLVGGVKKWLELKNPLAYD